jgi:hypothetical protein
MRPVVIAVLLTSLLAACGGDDDTTGSTERGGDGSGSTLGGGAVANPEEEVDCAVLRDTDKVGSLIGLQLMPQMTSQSVIDTVKSGSAPFDPDALVEYLEALRPLGGREYSPFGDPADEIERYITVAQAARDLLAVEGPVSPDQLNAYVALVGDPVTFLGGQAAIGAALDENCPA